jgi:hypothetical protein
MPSAYITHLSFGFDGDLFAVGGQYYRPSNVYRIDKNGNWTLFSEAGPQSKGSDGMAYSGGGALGDYLYVSEFDTCVSEGDDEGNPIYQIAPDGTRTLFAAPANVGCGYRLTGLEVGPGGNFGSDLFAIYLNSGSIYKVSGTDPATLFAAIGGQAETLAFGSADNVFGEHLFVAKDFTGDLVEISPQGTVSVFGSDFAGFNYAGTTGLKFSADKKMLFVTDDNAGVIYNITLPKFQCVGFEPPLAFGPVSVNKSRALPLKAELLEEGGIPVTGSDLEGDAPVIQILYQSGTGEAMDVTSEALPVGQGTSGNKFVYTEDGKWQYNLSTKNYSAKGTYTVTMVPGQSYFVEPTCTAVFVIK